MLLHLPILFISHWSWHPGTKAFDFTLTTPLYDAESQRLRRLREIGAKEIEEYLNANPNKKLCVGYSKG